MLDKRAALESLAKIRAILTSLSGTADDVLDLGAELSKLEDIINKA